MREREIFLAACEIEDPNVRNEFLDRTCAGNLDLRRRLEELVSANSDSSEFLTTPAVDQICQNSRATTADRPAFTSETDLASVTMQDAENFRSEDLPLPEISLDFLEPSLNPGGMGRLGEYEILEVIGSGAFGIVLRACDVSLNRDVAIKILKPDVAATSPARKRFLREARAAAAVRHDHVVHIYAVHEQPIPHLIMELIPGQTIQQRIDEQGPLDIADIVRLGKQISSGLAAAHANGLVHRDIKPSNIVLAAGNAKITDFGLARAVDDASITQSGFIAGTPMYMSPEQAAGENVDHRTDLFSLGSVLYAMASGQAPFRASTTVGVLKCVATSSPRPIREIQPDVPEWLCAIISKLHEKRPENRYGSASEVANLLHQCSIDIGQGVVPKMNDGNSSRSVWTILTATVAVLGIALFFIPGLSVMSKSASQINPPAFANGESIELGSLLSPSCIADGQFDDVTFRDGLLTMDATNESPNLWVNFATVEGTELTIHTQMRVTSPRANGSLKMVFLTHNRHETIAQLHRINENNEALLKKYVNHTFESEVKSEIPTVKTDEWNDLTFVVTHDQFSFLINDRIVADMPRTEQLPGFVAICCRGWQCELKQPTVVVTKNTQPVPLP